MKDKAFLVVALLVVAGVWYVSSQSPTDRLSAAESGVAASMAVHAAIIDGANGQTISAVSATLEPTAASAASIAPASLGNVFAPLAYTTSSCTTATNIKVVANPDTGTDADRNVLDTPSDRIRGRVTVLSSGNSVDSASIQLYRASESGDTLIATLSTNSQGGFTTPDFATVHGAAYFVKASKYRYCPTIGPLIYAGAAPAADSTTTSPSPTTTSPTSSTTTTTTSPTPTTTTTTTSPPPVTSSTTSAQNSTTDASQVYIPVGVTGSIQTKNLASGVTITGHTVISTPAGKSFNRSFNSVSVPAAGGALSGFGGNFSLPKADVGTGRTTLTIVVTAESTDLTGLRVRDSASIQMFADTDYSGQIRISLAPATGSTLALFGEGYGVRTTTLRPEGVA